MIRRLLGALQFLTVLPILTQTASLGESAIFFPLVGALLGASAGAVLVTAHNFGPVFAIVWLLLVTGCLHEDGLADVADALRAGRTREKMLIILKDSRIGTYGALALIASFAVRWHALAQSFIEPVASLVAVLTLSRTSMVLLAWWAQPAGSGLGQAFIAACSPRIAMLALAQAMAIVAVACWFIGWRNGALLLIATVAVTFVAKLYFAKRLGGVNGDCLGATCQVVEMVCLVFLAWRPSI